MKINSLLQFTSARIVRTRFHAPGMILATFAASAALFLFSGPSMAQSAAKQRPMTGRTSSAPAVSEGVASNPSSNSATRTAAKSAAPAPAAAPAVPHAPAVAYLLLQSAQGPVSGGSTDAMHRNWIAVSAIDRGSLADGAAKGQASDAMDHKNISDGAAKGQASDAAYKDSPKSGDNPLYEGRDAMDHKNISDGAAKSQAVDGMMQNPGSGTGAGNGQSAGIVDSKNISDGAAKGQASDATAPGFPALDAGSKDAAKMASVSSSHSGSVAIVKEMDESSPLLARAAASGNHFSSAQLDVLDGGVWHHYQLSDVTVSSVEHAGGGNRPTEQISLNFQRMELK